MTTTTYRAYGYPLPNRNPIMAHFACAVVGVVAAMGLLVWWVFVG